MPQPTLALAAASPTSFTATAGGTPGRDTTVYYRRVGDSVDTTLGTVSGSGVLTATGLSPGASYQAYATTSEASGGLSPPAFAWVSLASGEANHVSTAFHSHFNSSAPLVAELPGGLWTGEVPEGTPLPYAWLDVSSVDTSPTFEQEFDRASVTVHVFALGAAAVEKIVAVWRAAFNYETITFPDPSTAACVQLFQRRYRLVCELVRHRDSRLVYHGILTYHLLVQRPR